MYNKKNKETTIIENPEITMIDTRMNNEDINKYPKFGWFFPCLICCIPTYKETTFTSIKSQSIRYNKQIIQKNKGYIAAMCINCTRRLKNGLISSLCYYKAEN